jgi:phosphopantothenoylcysteine decarboxylase/phosphopantothenate--cysteine ligase
MSAPRIVLGVTGSIGAYKAAEILRQLQKAGADVTVAMTRHAAEFITPLTMQTLSGHPVAMEMYDLARGADIEHIELVRTTDLLLVAPATANIIGKFASGVADDFLSTFYTAVTCPVLIAPAMNTRMWSAEAMQENVVRLGARGAAFVEPESGSLACGEEGEGRLADPALIVSQALALARTSRSLEGFRVLVTAGPTREPIDPVRFVSNRSSGRMGYAVAAALARRRATVTLISGPTALPVPYGVERIDVETAAEMGAEVAARWPAADALWMAAAVADFRPAAPAAVKIGKREGGFAIAWTPTEDILRAAGRTKRPGQILVGFAAETGDPAARARAKLEEKNLDFIVANDVSRPGAGFDSRANEVTLFRRGGEPVAIPLALKGAVAETLVSLVHGAGMDRESDRAASTTFARPLSPVPGDGARRRRDSLQPGRKGRR